MSRRKTVKVLRLEGRAKAYENARSDYSHLGGRLRDLFRDVANPSLRDVRAAVREGLLEMEREVLNEMVDEMTKAQRAQEEA